MANTKKYKKSTNRNAKRRTYSRMSSSKKHQELYAKNKKRNSIIRNIRMGRATFNRIGGAGYMRKDGGGYTCQQGGSSQFVGAPWTVSNNPNPGNYFAQSPLGVGTELVPKFDNGLPLYPAKFPTQLGPQVAKLGEMKGGGYGYGFNKHFRSGVVGLIKHFFIELNRDVVFILLDEKRPNFFGPGFLQLLLQRIVWKIFFEDEFKHRTSDSLISQHTLRISLPSKHELSDYW